MSMPIQWRFSFLCRVECGAAAAERVEDDVAFVAGGFNNAFEEGDGFLGGVAETLVCQRMDRRNLILVQPATFNARASQQSPPIGHHEHSHWVRNNGCQVIA